MPVEISREITPEGKVKVTYDDQSVELLDTPQTYQDVHNDGDADEEMNSGHVFKPEELQ